MTLEYSIDEMKSALERWGYQVVLEDAVEIVSHYHREEVPRKVYAVYHKGSSMAEWMGLGTRRLIYVFEHEFKDRLLKMI